MNRSVDCKKLGILNLNEISLYLNNNEITEIPEGTFDGLDKLAQIHLDNNKLSRIPRCAFKGALIGGGTFLFLLPLALYTWAVPKN